MCTSASSSLGRRAGRAAALVAAVALGGCAAGPDFERPAAPPVTGYLPGGTPAPTEAAAGAAQHFATGAPLRADWWTGFGAAGLDVTVGEALARNPTLASASATLRQSQDQLRAGYGVFFPEVGVELGAVRQRVTPSRLGLSGPSSLFNLFTLTGAVSYVVDLFGGARRQVEAASATVDFEQNRWRAAYLTLTTNVVNASIARAAYRAQAEATRASIEATRERVAIGEAQYAAGTIAYTGVASLRTELAALETSLPPLEQRAEAAEHLLAALVGRMPAEWTPPELALGDLKLPEELPLSLPSALVRQRPDVLAAEAQLHVASAEVGVATASLLPTLTLTGALGQQSTNWSTLGDSSSRFWSAGGDLSVPVFQGGRAWYGRKAAVDAYEAARADYRQVVIAAFQQVADVLRALDHDAAALRAAAEGRDAAQTTLALADADYRAGIADYLALMIATRQYQDAQIAYIAAAAQRLQDTVALYAALGGGWWNAPSAVPGP